MASNGLQTLIYGMALCVLATAVTAAEDDEAADMAFLEYLGMWEASDEEWLLLDEGEVTDNEQRSDPVPDGEESTETNDES